MLFEEVNDRNEDKCGSPDCSWMNYQYHLVPSGSHQSGPKSLSRPDFQYTAFPPGFSGYLRLQHGSIDFALFDCSYLQLSFLEGKHSRYYPNEL